MALNLVNSFVAGNSIDVVAQFLNVRTGLPASTAVTNVAISLFDANGVQQVTAAAMAIAPNNPPGYWIFTYQTSNTQALGTWTGQFQVTDSGGNVWISSVENIFTLTSV